MEHISGQNADGGKDAPEYGIRLEAKKFLWFIALLLGIYIAICLVTRFVPQGAYERGMSDGAEYLIDGTYAEFAVQDPLPVWRYFTLPFEMLFSSDGIMIALVLLLMMVISGTVYVLDKGNVIRRFAGWILRVFGKRRYILASVMITVCTVLSSLGILSLDELLALTPFTVAMAVGMGWDSLVGVGLCFLPITNGMIGGTLNPYNVVLPQQLAGLPIYSGMGLRIAVLVCVWALTMVFVLLYAKRVERDPARSLMYHEDAARRERYAADKVLKIEKRHYPFREIAKDFGKSALEWLVAMPVILLIMSYSFVLEKGQVMDTVIYNFTNLISGMSAYGAALAMLALVLTVEIFLPGAIVKAVAIMPLLLPVGDVVGISRQTSCLIFMLGDSYPNILFPTNTYVLIVMGMIGCKYSKWLRWMWWYLLALLAMMVAAVLLAVKIGYV